MSSVRRHMRRELPPNFDLAPLVGCELISVLIGGHHAELRFLRAPHVVAGKTRDDGCRVDVEAGFVLRQADAEQIVEYECRNLRNGAASLVSLIDQPIESAIREKEGSLALVFTNGARLTVLVGTDGFDSYHVHTANASASV